jgi:hypothetical protein
MHVQEAVHLLEPKVQQAEQDAQEAAASTEELREMLMQVGGLHAWRCSCCCLR